MKKIIFSLTNLLISINYAAAEPTPITNNVTIYVDQIQSKAMVDISLCSEKTPPESACATSLEAAIQYITSQQWVKKLPADTKKIIIELKNINYRIENPLEIQWKTPGISLSILGKGQDNTSISGSISIPLTPTSPSASLDKRIPVDFIGKIWAGNIDELLPPPSSTGFGLPIQASYGEPFWMDEPQPIAGWPNNGYTKIDTSLINNNKEFSLLNNHNKKLNNEPDLHIKAYWGNDWAEQSHPVSADNDNHLIISTPPTFGIKSGQRARIEYALSELDSPGEWYIDRKKKLIYWWPMPFNNEKQPLLLEWSKTKNLIKISNSSNIEISGLTLKNSTGNTVEINNSQNVSLHNLTIKNSSTLGLSIINSNDSGIKNCTIENMGEGGIILDGGNRNTLSPGHNFVSDCQILKFSRITKTYRPAIRMSGVGNVIEGNKISNSPHAAIIFDGNDHLIKNNEIFNVVTETSDAGAIYTGRNYTAQGTVIEENFLHDIYPKTAGFETKGIYLDDQASGTIIRRNIFSRVNQAVFIGGGRDNRVEENIFYKSSPAISLDTRGTTWQKEMTTDPEGALQKNLDAVPIKSQIWQKKYPHLVKIRADSIGAPKYNTAQNNKFIDSTPLNITKDAETGISMDKPRIQGEEAFATPLSADGRKAKLDFSLR